jgi:predicted MFS family arabinose efflux permease
MSRSAARTAAPAMVGALIAYGNGPLAIASTAALYGVGVVVVLGFRESVPGRVDATHIGVEIVEGLRHTWVNPVVRRVGVFTAVAFFGWGSLYGAVPVFIQHTLHGGPMLTGVTFAVFGLVGVATGLLSGRIATEGREGTVLFICAALAGVALLLIGLGQGMAAMFAGIVGLGIVETPVDQAAHGARQRYCSPAMLGRVTAVGTAVDIAACGLGIFVSAALAGMNPPATLAAFGVWVVCASMLGPWACTTTARRRALTMALNGRLAHPEPAARDR